MITPKKKTIGGFDVINSSSCSSNESFRFPRDISQGNTSFGERILISNFKEYSSKFRVRFVNENNELNNSIQSTDLKSLASFNILSRKLSAKSVSSANSTLKKSKLYLYIIQKSILLFNNKKYEKSYLYLRNHKIINSLLEFSEILLVTTGYDKNEIGNFLSKNSEFNPNYALLAFFIHKVNYAGVDIMTSFRFFLSRLNLPSDSTLLLKIIEFFSKYYYEDNEASFKNSNSVYLLFCSILSINTILHRTDISHVNKISLDDFIKINNEIDRDLCVSIYNEINKNPLNITYDYKEMFNRRLTVISNFDYHNNDSVMQEDLCLENSKDSDTLSIMMEGETFVKYEKKKKTKTLLILDKIKPRLVLKTTSGFFCSATRHLCIKDITDVYYGSPPNINIPLEDQGNFFYFDSTFGIIAFKAETPNLARTWYQGIKLIIKELRGNPDEDKLPCSDTMNYHTNTLLSPVIKQAPPSSPDLKFKEYQEFFCKEVVRNWDQLKVSIFTQMNEFISAGKVLKRYSALQKKRTLSLGSKGDKMAYLAANLYKYGLIPEYREAFWDILIRDIMSVSSEAYHLKMSTIRLSGTSVNDEMAKHIRSLAEKMSQYPLVENEEKQMKFVETLQSCSSIFFGSRNDIPYHKSFLYVLSIFVLNSTDEFSAYKHFVNFYYGKGNCILKFNLFDSSFLDMRIKFFNEIFKITLPSLYQHFSKLEIETKMFLTKWFRTLFVEYFVYRNEKGKKGYETVVKIFDIFLVRGEVFLFELALTILELLENKLESVSIEKIFTHLDKFPYDIVSETTLFVRLLNTHIENLYDQMVQTELKTAEKKLLTSN